MDFTFWIQNLFRKIIYNQFKKVTYWICYWNFVSVYVYFKERVLLIQEVIMFYNNILLLSFMSRASGSHWLLFNYSKICEYCTQRTLYYHLSFLPIVLIILNKVKYYCQAGGLNTTACLDQSSEVPRVCVWRPIYVSLEIVNSWNCWHRSDSCY